MSSSLPPQEHSAIIDSPYAPNESLVQRRRRIQKKLSKDEQKLAMSIVATVAPVPLKQLAMDAGLPPEIINRVSKISRTAPFMEFLDCIGASREFLALALLSDIVKKRGNRLGELRLLAELQGLVKKPVPSGETSVDQSMTFIQNIINDVPKESLPPGGFSDDDVFDVESSSSNDNDD